MLLFPLHARNVSLAARRRQAHSPCVTQQLSLFVRHGCAVEARAKTAPAHPQRDAYRSYCYILLHSVTTDAYATYIKEQAITSFPRGYLQKCRRMAAPMGWRRAGRQSYGHDGTT